MPPYGLIFDVDGVLGDTEGVVARATIAMFQELYGVEMKEEDFRPFIGTGAVRYVEGPAEKYGVTVDIDKACARRTENFIAILESGEPISFPGAKELVDAAVAAEEWKVAVATSGPTDKSQATVRAAGIDPSVFNVYITGDMVTHKKPHPEIYETTAKALQLAPGHCVVVEDAITGVASAKAAGMPCIAVTNSFSAVELAEADLVVNSLAQVTLDVLKGLIAS